MKMITALDAQYADVQSVLAKAQARANEMTRQLAKDPTDTDIIEDCLLTADTPEMGVIETVRTGGKNPGREVRTGDMLEHRKLKIWTRLQLLAKWFPTKYGDRVALDHTVKSDIAERIIAGRKRARPPD